MRKLLLILLFSTSLFAEDNLPVLYSSLDPLSVSQNFAFYELYPETPYGKKALERGWSLLLKGDPLARQLIPPQSLPVADIQGIIALVNSQSYHPKVEPSELQLQVIEKLSESLSNRSLKGHSIWSLEELNKLEDEEIDIARAVLLQEFSDKDHILRYEANLDLIALQIKARLPQHPTPEEMVGVMNRLIFQELHFRFPPHSKYAKDIDLYTFLPSVLDSRQGVCLGVSILYLSIAQRLNFPLEIITPPGHIYVRYHDKDTLINIETTARGIDIPSENYLGLNTHKLHECTLKEVVGCSLINQASVMLGRQDFKAARALYERAYVYMPDDMRLNMLLGLSHLFCGNLANGKSFLQKIKGKTFEDAVYPESLPEDFLNGRVDIESIKSVFMPVDENRESILNKQKELVTITKRFPKFRDGLMQLATTYLQLGRRKEALECLNSYHALDPFDPTVEYYLLILNLESLDYPKAWKHYEFVKETTSKKGYHPKVLRQLHHTLMQESPKPLLQKN